MEQTHIISELARSKHTISVLEIFYNFKEVDCLELFLLNKNEAVKTLEKLKLIELSNNKAKITELGMEIFNYMLLR